MFKGSVERKEDTRKELGAKDEIAKERCMKVHKEERKVKSTYFIAKRR